jgi:hypothetical protein
MIGLLALSWWEDLGASNDPGSCADGGITTLRVFHAREVEGEMLDWEVPHWSSRLLGVYVGLATPPLEKRVATYFGRKKKSLNNTVESH